LPDGAELPAGSPAPIVQHQHAGECDEAAEKANPGGGRVPQPQQLRSTDWCVADGGSRAVVDGVDRDIQHGDDPDGVTNRNASPAAARGYAPRCGRRRVLIRSDGITERLLHYWIRISSCFLRTFESFVALPRAFEGQTLRR